jgi:succinate dehydrogenase/fumarate reductase flavoprotein subunit
MALFLAQQPSYKNGARGVSSGPAGRGGVRMTERVEACDVLVAGTGAAGLTAAIAAARAGGRVVVVESESTIGGTTAYSGGVLWVPGSRHWRDLTARRGQDDSVESARAYVREIAGAALDEARLDAYLQHAPRMVEFLERESAVQFYGLEYPDYVSESPHARTLRSIATRRWHVREAGDVLALLRPDLPQTMFLGLPFGSSVEIREFMNAGSSLRSLGVVLKRLAAHARDMATLGRSAQLVRGQALIARLARTVRDLGIPVHVGAPLRELVVEGGAVRGARVGSSDAPWTIAAARGVILACGGFGRDAARRASTYAPAAVGAAPAQVVAAGATGGGQRAAERAGAVFSARVNEPAAWMPVSRIPGTHDESGVWPHVVDRPKAGFIAVTRRGRRFVDESRAYHEFVPAMVRASAADGEPEAAAWLVADERTVRRWGIGFVRPWPIPKGRHVASGYLLRGATLRELAVRAGIDPEGLEATVHAWNAQVREGRDREFGRGERLYDRFQGDDAVTPNPCLAPVERPAFYAVRLYATEIGTFAGLATDAQARVLDGQGRPIHGLYAAGNDQLNVFGGTYPGAGATLGPAMTFGYLAGRHAAGARD